MNVKTGSEAREARARHEGSHRCTSDFMPESAPDDDGLRDELLARSSVVRKTRFFPQANVCA